MAEAPAQASGGGLSPDAFRRALGQFPTGVTIATVFWGDRPVGMTANSFSSVSLDPPLVLWCVAKAAPSYPAFLEADAFAIHFLGADHHELALRFAGQGRSADKFAGLAFVRGESGAPILDGIAPIFECRIWARHDGGDHTILVGEVVHFIAKPHDPLLFHSGELRRIGGRRRELPRDSFAKTYLAYLLARASHIVSGEFHVALKRWRLSVGEWRVLACLADAEGLGVGELAAMALMQQPRMTKILDRMEADGTIERRADPGDRRRALVHLTEPGRARVAPVLAAAKEHEAAILAPFTDEERAMIKHALHLLIDRHGESAG
ncbi:MAG TPA: flavin reductase [Beijerinckiaceae bacterium]|jgi:3-hydroxy-9,10-secoandrosta-1,3,5(10)-triene-9,17-dione monooxygenase reductase component